MFSRWITNKLHKTIAQRPVVALLGARQVGKTTLAKTIAQSQNSVYLDLEAPEDLLKLSDPTTYLERSERQTYHIRRNSARPRVVYSVARTYR